MTDDTKKKNDDPAKAETAREASKLIEAEKQRAAAAAATAKRERELDDEARLEALSIDEGLRGYLPSDLAESVLDAETMADALADCVERIARLKQAASLGLAAHDEKLIGLLASKLGLKGRQHHDALALAAALREQG